MATTYLTPGVYVEEVPSGSATLAPGATAVAAFVGFTAKGPRDDPSDPLGQKPRLVTNWTQFEQLYGGFTRARCCRTPCTATSTTAARSPTSCASRTPSRRREPGTLALPRGRPRARPGRRDHDRRAERRHRRDRHAGAAGRRRRRRAADVPRRRHRERRAEPVESFSGLTLTQGRPQRRDRRQQGVDEGQGGDEDRRLEARGRPRQPARRQLPDRAGAADARSPCPAGRSPARRRPARASTASSSPRTSRW